MAVTCDWLCACQTAIVDRISGRISLIQVVETVAAPRFPAQLPTFHVVATWQNHTEMSTAAKLRIRIEELGADGGSQLTEEDVTFSGRTTHRSICIVQSLTVLRPGAYRVVAQMQPSGGESWSDAASYPFQVVSAQAPSGAAMA